MIPVTWLAGGAFLGWSLGANTASTVFGTAVSTNAVRFRTAAFCICVFAVLGAYLQGAGGIRTLQGLSGGGTIQSAFTIVFATALTVTAMTVLRLPVSASQGVVGAIIGMSIALGHKPGWDKMPKIVMCWVGTPVGAILASAVLYWALGYVWDYLDQRLPLDVSDMILSIAMIAVGSYGAYALGANNIANVVGVFAGFEPFKSWDVRALSALGALSINLGVLTYGKRVMYTVGENLVPLEPFTAFISVLAQALTVHVYAMVGVPVSIAQAIVGSVLGIGLVKGVQSVNTRTLISIVIAWVSTPLAAGVVSYLMYKLIFVAIFHV